MEWLKDGYVQEISSDLIDLKQFFMDYQKQIAETSW